MRKNPRHSNPRRLSAVTIRTFRSSRSASGPPTKVNSASGTVWAAKTRVTSAGDPVRS